MHKNLLFLIVTFAVLSTAAESHKSNADAQQAAFDCKQNGEEHMEFQNSAPEKILNLVYTNWRGQTSKRSIIPVEVFWGKTEWHPHEQWLLKCWDIDRNDYRVYALKEIKEIL